MPHKNHDEHLRYMREYLGNKYLARKLYWMTLKGSCCSACGSIHRLEFDHIDPATKEFNISDMLIGSAEKLEREMEKIQLLCYSCHKKKTALEASSRVTHGDYHMYAKYGCRCQLCIDGYRKTNRQYKENSKRNKDRDLAQ